MQITSISFVSIIVALTHHPTFAIEKGVAEVNDDDNNNHNLLRQRYLQRCPVLGDKCTDRKPCCLDSKLSCKNGRCESSVTPPPSTPSPTKNPTVVSILILNHTVEYVHTICI